MRLREQGLDDPDAATAESVRRSRHVEAPHAIRLLAHQRDCFAAARLQAADPMAERKHVMLAQTLDVAQLEADALRARNDRRRGQDLAVGKNLAIDELAALPEPRRQPRRNRRRPRCLDAHDAMIQEQAAWA